MPKKSDRNRGLAKCPACGNEKAQIVRHRSSFSEPDVQGTFYDEITSCDACGESIYTFRQAEAHARAYAAAVARARGSFTGDRIWNIRQSLNKSQSDMEEALGIGPKTYGRWERGMVVPSGPAVRLLWIAENDPATFLRMVNAHSPGEQLHYKVAGEIVPAGPGLPPIKVANRVRMVGKADSTSTRPSRSDEGAV